MIQPQIASGAGENGWNSSCLSGDKTDTPSVDQQIAYGTVSSRNICECELIVQK
jgi:hypothetical protein